MVTCIFRTVRSALTVLVLMMLEYLSALQQVKPEMTPNLSSWLFKASPILSIWYKWNNEQLNILNIFCSPISVPPRVLSVDPLEQQVISGSPITLGCDAEGDPPPSVRWRKDLQEINFYDPTTRYILTETGSLLIAVNTIKTFYVFYKSLLLRSVVNFHMECF